MFWSRRTLTELKKKKEDPHSQPGSAPTAIPEESREESSPALSRGDSDLAEGADAMGRDPEVTLGIAGGSLPTDRPYVSTTAPRVTTEKYRSSRKEKQMAGQSVKKKN